MNNCNTCETRHCNGCKFDPTKAERKPEVLYKEVDFNKSYFGKWPFEEVPYSQDFTFSFIGPDNKILDKRVYIVSNDRSSFVLNRYKSSKFVSPLIENLEPEPLFTVSTEKYDFRMYVCKKTIFLEEVRRLGFSKTCELLSLFFLECIDRELGDKQEMFPVKEYKNRVDTKYNIHNDSLTFRMSTYVGVKE